MNIEEKEKIASYVEFITYLNSPAIPTHSKKDNYFLCDFMRKNENVYKESPNIYNLLGLRNNKRNEARILLPFYTTERIIDEHFSCLIESWTIREHIADDVMIRLIDKEVDFANFIHSYDLFPELNALVCDESILKNNYTDFVYNEILLKERDYLDNIVNALCKGSRPEVDNMLNKINWRDKATSENEMKMLVDAELPYLIEYCDYIKKCWDSVNYIVDDYLMNPDNKPNDKEFVDGLAYELLFEVGIEINHSLYHIMEVEISYNTHHGKECGGYWCIADDAISIIFGDEETARKGYVKINCIKSASSFIETPREVSRFVRDSICGLIDESLSDIKLISRRNKFATDKKLYVKDEENRHKKKKSQIYSVLKKDESEWNAPLPF